MATGWKCVVDVTLPYPPTANQLWRTYRGRQVLSEAAQRYKEAVAGQWWVARMRQGAAGIGALPCQVIIVAYPPDRRRRDLDNLLKIILDSAQGCGILADDAQVRRIIIKWGERRKAGAIRLRIAVPEG